MAADETPEPAWCAPARERATEINWYIRNAEKMRAEEEASK
jgi:hypothetical protein